MNCIYLGEPNGQRIKVECRPQRVETVYQCLHPERRQVRTGRPKPCVPDWPGPWKLPDQKTEAAIYQVCVCCRLRSEAN